MKMEIRNFQIIKFLLLLVLLWIGTVDSAFGQSMISVNRNVLRAQRQKAKAKQAKSRSTYTASKTKTNRTKASKSNTRKSRSRRTYRNRYKRPETYLYVDGSLNPSITVPAEGGTVNLSIFTNAKSVSVNGLSTSYMNLTYVSTDFVQIQFDPNASHATYNDWFDICAGDKMVRTYVVRQGKPYDNVQAYIHAALISEDKQNVIISGSMQISGAAQSECSIVAYIEDSNGWPYKSADSRYSIAGNAYAAASFTPETDDVTTENFNLVIPKTAIYFPKKKNYVQAEIYVFCNAICGYVTKYTTSIIKVKRAKRW